MSVRYIAIKHIVRRLRGGSQAFLVQGTDDLFYVAKFAGNPQGTRTLINEWIAGQLLHNLEVSTPDLQILTLDETARGRDELCFKIGSKTLKIEGHFHLGSRCPVDPTTTVILDFLPRQLLSKVINLPEFALMFVIDLWLGQTDTRQAVFVREKRIGKGLVLRSYFIDQGMCLGGSRWEFYDSPLQGRYMDQTVYTLVDMAGNCNLALSRIQALSEDALYATTATIPPNWLAEGDHAALAHLLRSLEQRRQKLPFLLGRSLPVIAAEHNRSA